MKRLFIIGTVLLIIGIMAIHFMFHGISDAEIDEIKKNVNDNYNVYQNARDKNVTYTCAYLISGYQGIKLKPSFYIKAKTISTDYFSASQNLLDFLTKLKAKYSYRLGKPITAFKDSVSEQMQASVGLDFLSPGYCRHADNPQQINEVIKQFRATPPLKGEHQNEPNTIYLNKTGQVTQLTLDFSNEELPTNVVMDSTTYPIQCHYLDAQSYIQKIANNHFQLDAIYYSSREYYLKHSPHIDYILDCQSTRPFTQKQQTEWNDAYSWYHPIVKGSNTDAEGSVLTYLSDKRLIMVLGHDPHECNNESMRTCETLKSLTRNDNQKNWNIIDTVQTDLNQMDSNKKQNAADYLTYVKAELQKDFTDRDHAEVFERFKTLLGDEPKCRQFLGILKNNNDYYQE